LGRWITSEKADATGSIVYLTYQLIHTSPATSKMSELERPVLAEQAIEIAGFKKHCKVVITHLWTPFISKPRITAPGASGAYPISYTIGWKGIQIRRKLTSQIAI